MAEARETVVEVRGLAKRYGARTALAGVDLEVRAGEIVGLVGANGAGKTTLLRILAGFQRPDAGSVRVLGHEPWTARARLMERARFAFAPPALFEGLSAREHLVHLARLGAPRADARAEIQRALERVGLAARADEPVRAFSFGMRQRLALALALVPTPALLVLDEPTEGLDPLAIRELRGLLAELRAELGLALLVSSHLLVELDHLADRLLVLSEGHVRFRGTPESLREAGACLVLRARDPARARELLRAQGHEPRDGEDGALELAAGALALEDARALLGPGQLESFHARRPSLEEALLRHLEAGP